jgi:hypothetical protein
MRQLPTFSHSPTGYFLNLAHTNISAPHIVGGPQSLTGAISPNSGLPLLLLLTLDLTDPRLGIRHNDVERIHLLYSWNCAISDGEFSYRESKRGIEILSYTKGPSQSAFPYANYPPFFPAMNAEFQQLTATEQAIIKKMNRREGEVIELETEFPLLAVPRSQVGGEPRLLQWPLSPRTCPACRGPMPLLGTVGNANGTAAGFAGNEFVQVLFYFCIACVAVTAFNLTD